MFKAIILLARNDGMSREAFRDWMLVAHSPLARQLPGVRKLVFNLVENDDVPYDGVSELWFDSREAFDAAYQTEIGKAVAGDSMANVKARIRLFVDEQPQIE
ncbi:MAG: EthD domain-containing protein [Chloroflexota bacterium]